MTYRVWVDARGVGMTLYADYYIDVVAPMEDMAVEAARKWARRNGLRIEKVHSVEVQGGRVARFMDGLTRAALGGPHWRA